METHRKKTNDGHDLVYGAPEYPDGFIGMMRSEASRHGVPGANAPDSLDEHWDLVQDALLGALVAYERWDESLTTATLATHLRERARSAIKNAQSSRWGDDGLRPDGSARSRSGRARRQRELRGKYDIYAAADGEVIRDPTRVPTGKPNRAKVVWPTAPDEVPDSDAVHMEPRAPKGDLMEELDAVIAQIPADDRALLCEARTSDVRLIAAAHHWTVRDTERRIASAERRARDLTSATGGSRR
jgi:hypothetical protein